MEPRASKVSHGPASQARMFPSLPFRQMSAEQLREQIVHLKTELEHEREVRAAIVHSHSQACAWRRLRVRLPVLVVVIVLVRVLLRDRVRTRFGARGAPELPTLEDTI
eukprot:2254371-Pleurochrysis_carterae.AAC.1